MMLSHPEIEISIDFEEKALYSLVIENPEMMLRLLSDISAQLDGLEGDFVLSENGKSLPMSKNLEMITSFVPFDINRKTLVNRISGELEKQCSDELHYEKTMELLTVIENHLYDVAFDLLGDIRFAKIDMGQIIKAVGLEINSDYSSLGEKLIDYFELVSEYDKEKLFVLVNLRSFLSEKETVLFSETILSHGFYVLLIDNHEYCRLPNEVRVIIDNDLCKIQ